MHSMMSLLEDTTTVGGIILHFTYLCCCLLNFRLLNFNLELNSIAEYHILTMLGEYLFVLSILLGMTKAVELTFELPDSAKECFFEIIQEGTESTVEYQVRVSI